jgi:hypothetical protein
MSGWQFEHSQPTTRTTSKHSISVHLRLVLSRLYPMIINVGFSRRWRITEVCCVLYTLNPPASTCRELYDFCIATMVAVFFGQYSGIWCILACTSQCRCVSSTLACISRVGTTSTPAWSCCVSCGFWTTRRRPIAFAWVLLHVNASTQSVNIM